MSEEKLRILFIIEFYNEYERTEQLWLFSSLSKKINAVLVLLPQNITTVKTENTII